LFCGVRGDCPNLSHSLDVQGLCTGKEAFAPCARSVRRACGLCAMPVVFRASRERFVERKSYLSAPRSFDFPKNVAKDLVTWGPHGVSSCKFCICFVLLQFFLFTGDISRNMWLATKRSAAMRKDYWRCTWVYRSVRPKASNQVRILNWYMTSCFFWTLENCNLYVICSGI
jgi:hypothetical protein